jgi:hypothetical protein
MHTVAHWDLSLTITENQKRGSGNHVFTRRYTTDGKEVEFLENGANVKARAFWAGEFLVIESNADADGITVAFVEELTLSKSGNTVSHAVQVVTPQGEFEATIRSRDRRGRESYSSSSLLRGLRAAPTPYFAAFGAPAAPRRSVQISVALREFSAEPGIMIAYAVTNGVEGHRFPGSFDRAFAVSRTRRRRNDYLEAGHTNKGDESLYDSIQKNGNNSSHFCEPPENGPGKRTTDGPCAHPQPGSRPIALLFGRLFFASFALGLEAFFAALGAVGGSFD